MANSRQPPLDYSRFNPRASGIPQYGSKEEAQEALKWAAMEAGLLMFPYGRTYQYGKGVYQAGLPGLAAQWASRKGSAPIPTKSWYKDLPPGEGKELASTVDDLFVKKPGYHGTEDPFFFERGVKGVEGGVKIPSDIQISRNMKAPTFSISSSKRFADVWAGKGVESLGGNELKRTIPVLIDKKATKKILDYRNFAHKKYIKQEYRKYRKDLRKDMEGNLTPNTKVSKKALKSFDDATQKDLMNLDKWSETNWHIMEKLIPQFKQRGWKAFTATEGNVLNLQIMDPKIIRAYRDKAGNIVNEMNEGGKVPGGGIGNFVPENLRKKQVTVHKPSKSLVKQGYSPEARLKARYRNTSYFG
jgi:hypothetical protein